MRVTADKVYNDLVNKQDELAELQSPTKFFCSTTEAYACMLTHVFQHWMVLFRF